MNVFKLYISIDTETSGITYEWASRFITTLQLLIENSLKKPVNILSSFDFIENPVSKKELNDVDEVILFITNGYTKNPNCLSELNELKEYKLTTRKILFTSPSKEVVDDDFQGTVHNFLPVFDENRTNVFSDENIYTTKDFWLMLIDLVYAIVPTDLKKKKNDKTIFLAETTPDLSLERLALKRELRHTGYNVLPSEQFFFTKAHLEAATTSAIEKANLIVQLFGGSRGNEIENENITMLQNKLAAKHSKKTGETNRLIWIPRDIIFKNREQRQVIEKLKRDSEGLSGAEIIQTPIETFKSIIHERINIATKKKSRREEQSSHFAYIIFNTENKPNISPIESILYEKNIKPLLAKESKSKKQMLEHHRESLINCNSVILFFDEKHIDWVKSKHKDIIKSAGLGRKTPINKKILITDKEPDTLEIFSEYHIIAPDNKGLEQIKELFTENE